MPEGIKVIPIIFFLTLALFSLSSAEESITITTYYPSPYGSYNELYVAGNTGIGTSTPVAKLDVRGNINIGGSVYGVQAGTSGLGIRLPSTGNDWLQILGVHDGSDDSNIVLMVGDNSDDGVKFNYGSLTDWFHSNILRTSILAGNFGIGADYPQYGNLQLSNNYRIYSTMSTNDYWQIYSEGGDDAGTMVIETGDNASEAIIFRQRETSGTTRNAMAISSSGNVGIGTASPGNYKLNVSGDAMVNRIYTQAASSAHGLGHNFSDIAEDIIAEGCEAGDVVVINPSNNESVIKSTKPYDTTVAGIISETPAFYIGKRDKVPYLPLALAGRVRCKVSIENGPIKRGDFLTSSSLPGHAMKATDKKRLSGTIVAKALDSFDVGPSGKKIGKIMVLITLQ
ncbi:MAG: hypothetical protein HY350_04940 [Candidatus Omnitrophica bacterium]|nr:hypothetical protein [Candidatus Omnitrophota bacterium]